MLIDATDSFDLRLSISNIQVLTWYTDNFNDSNSVINLIFLWADSLEINNHSILPDLCSPFDYSHLTVNIIIKEEFIQDKWRTIIKNSKEKEKFINDLKGAISNIDMFNISNIELLEKAI